MTICICTSCVSSTSTQQAEDDFKLLRCNSWRIWILPSVGRHWCLSHAVPAYFRKAVAFEWAFYYLGSLPCEGYGYWISVFHNTYNPFHLALPKVLKRYSSRSKHLPGYDLLATSSAFGMEFFENVARGIG